MDHTNPQENPQYEPPQVLISIDKFIKFIRFSTDFSDFFSPVEEKKTRYQNGLILIASLTTAFLVTWGLILIFLKCKGQAVGCASGRAFERKGKPREPTAQGEIRSCNGSTASEELSTKMVNHVDDASFCSSIYSSEANSIYESTDGNEKSINDIDDSSVDGPAKENPRAWQTRLAFLMFALIVLLCVPLILSFTFSPLKQAITTSEEVIVAGREVLFQVSTSTTTILSATENVQEILVDTPIQFDVFCPNVDEDEAIEELGVDLGSIASIIAVEYIDLEKSIYENISKLEILIEDISTFLDKVEVYFVSIDNVLWLVPGMLLSVSVLTGYATLGVLLARKQKSGKRFQFILSYVILPMLIIVCCGCWALAVATSVGAAVSSDLCIPDGDLESPDATIHDMLVEQNVDPNSTTFKFISAYTSGCREDPTQFLIELEEAAQIHVDSIWRHISTVDSVGRTEMIGMCGGRLNDLLSGARNLAKLLTKIRRAIDSASDSLECERIMPLYAEGVHDAICTEVASSAAWGFIFFAVIGSSMMVMITLRASWLFQFEEERVYHDEREVAENMIVDEHEEYLRYISKYRHEWQEYSGFETTSVKQSHSYSDQSSGEYDSISAASASSRSRDESTGTRTANYSCSDEEGAEIEIEEGRRVKTRVETVFESPSVASADISFPSLDVPPSDDSYTEDGAQVTAALPPLLVTDTGVTQDEDELDQVDSISFVRKTSDRMLYAERKAEYAAGVGVVSADVVDRKPESLTGKRPIKISTVTDLQDSKHEASASRQATPRAADNNTDSSEPAPVSTPKDALQTNSRSRNDDDLRASIRHGEDNPRASIRYEDENTEFVSARGHISNAENKSACDEDVSVSHGLIGTSVTTKKMYWQDQSDNAIEVVAISPVSFSSNDFSVLTSSVSKKFTFTGKHGAAEEGASMSQRRAASLPKQAKLPNTELSRSFRSDPSDPPGFHFQRNSPLKRKASDNKYENTIVGVATNNLGHEVILPPKQEQEVSTAIKNRLPPHQPLPRRRSSSIKSSSSARSASSSGSSKRKKSASLRSSSSARSASSYGSGSVGSGSAKRKIGKLSSSPVSSRLVGDISDFSRTGAAQQLQYANKANLKRAEESLDFEII